MNGATPATGLTVDRAECWIWTGPKLGRYGGMSHHLPYGEVCATGSSVTRRCCRHYAHRLAYELFVAPIPEGLTIDHLCMVKTCVNPAHLEAVTLDENMRRGRQHVDPAVFRHQSRKTHCPQGHPYDEANTYVSPAGRRCCRACRRERVADWYRRNRKAA